MSHNSVPRFFQTWDPIPLLAERPDDPALEQRIAKLADFAAKNGPPFVDMLREKQKDNPEYGFLKGGIGATYFRWKLYCVLYDLDPGMQSLQSVLGNPKVYSTDLQPCDDAECFQRTADKSLIEEAQQ